MFTPAKTALLVREVGGTDGEAVFLASVMPGESNGDPEVVNDRYSCGTENGRVLHAVGLVQICEYSSRGTREQLKDPRHNLKEGLKILRTQGKAAWTAIPDPEAASEARAALAGGATMQTWHPNAIEAPAGSTGGSYIGVPWKLVIHTIEAPPETLYSYNPSSYYGHTAWPHATIDTRGIHQHYPINLAARALYNATGGVETNNANAIQCEVMAQAALIDDLPEATWGHLVDWLSWCATQTRTPIHFANFVAGGYGEDAAQRFGPQEWLDFAGVCGHQHVPENDHWDPGALDTTKLAALMGQQEEDMTPEQDQRLTYMEGLLKGLTKSNERIETDLGRTGNPEGVLPRLAAIEKQLGLDKP